MSNGQDPLWQQIVAGAVAVITAVFSWMFKDVHDRIREARKKADDALSKSDFQQHLQRSLDDRQNLREDVKELFDRDDRMKDLITDRVDTLRRDMHDGIERLSREIRGGGPRP